MGDNADTVFVIFVFIMVLLFFILLVKRLYMRQNLINALNPGQLAGAGQLPGMTGGPSHLHENRGNSCPTWTHEMHQGPLDTAPPPFEAVVGASKGDFKADLSSATTSHPDMDCPPPSYEEYLGIVNQAFTPAKESPEKV
jgi:hypothetical protein